MMHPLLPPPPLDTHDISGWLMDAVPFLAAGTVLLAMTLCVLVRYNEQIREFWARHVVAFMEEHVIPECDGLMVERYLLGELTAEQREAVEAHVFECDKCRESMESGLRFIAALKHETNVKGGQ